MEAMSGALHLAWCYIARHRVQSALLALALGFTLAPPLLVGEFVRIAGVELRGRSAATPLVLGAKGSALELSLNALYFRTRGVEFIPMKHLQAARSSGLAQIIPVYARFHAQGAPIVGTTLDYFSFRKLRVEHGRMIARLGDCVIGAELARARGLKPGDALYSSPEQVFDIAGIYPLKMRITGVLARNHSADDSAAFVDVKTTWLIEGIAHGHEDLKNAPDASLLEKTNGNVVATNAVRMFSEVTDANIASFHFHGDENEFPVSCALVVPRDDKAKALLLGRYLDGKSGVQLVTPADEMDALLATLFRAERLALLLLVVLGVVVFFIAALVFAFSFRLRRAEFTTLEDIGIGRLVILQVKFFEVLAVGSSALLMTELLWLVVARYGAAWIRVGLG